MDLEFRQLGLVFLFNKNTIIAKFLEPDLYQRKAFCEDFFGELLLEVAVALSHRFQTLYIDLHSLHVSLS